MFNMSEELSDQFVLFPASKPECGVFPDIETMKVSTEFILHSPLVKFGQLVILKQI
jgi:hypothetical protein